MCEHRVVVKYLTEQGSKAFIVTCNSMNEKLLATSPSENRAAVQRGDREPRKKTVMHKRTTRECRSDYSHVFVSSYTGKSKDDRKVVLFSFLERRMLMKAPRVSVTQESSTGRNTKFHDNVTNRDMSRPQFVNSINAGQYPDYHVRNVNNVPTPVSNPDSKKNNNLG